jgi:hypothetical protein
MGCVAYDPLGRAVQKISSGKSMAEKYKIMILEK